MFFVSPIGLGHATRSIAIARELSCKVHFVSGGPAARMIENHGYPAEDVYLPNKFEVESGRLQNSFKWLMSYYSYYRKCREIAGRILDGSDAVVVSDEDFASIGVAQEAGRKSVLVTDILETHFTKGAASILEKKMNRAMQELIGRCDSVIIPDLGRDVNNLVHVGPIVRQASASREELRKKFGFTKKTILVSIGGTDAGRYLIEQAAAAHKRLGELDSDLVVVSGPSLKLAPGDYRDLGFVDNLHELVLAADLVVSLAGRSTMDESIAYGTPGIFIPIKGHFEQEDGAARLGFKYEDVYRLEELIREKISSPRGAQARSDGAARAAAVISRYL